MATRSIVTSQPDVACDVCERRLLRGEQWDVFLDAGQRRTVCELCAPRAANAGWLRESEHDPVEMPAPRPRRRRGLFGRLRPAEGRRSEPDAADAGEGMREPAQAPQEPPARPRADPVPARAGARRPQPQRPDVQEGVTDGDGRGERAVRAFNDSVHPRRVAGLARSLGVPAVSVRADEDVRHLVAIVIAWELCWYRYEVDVDEEEPQVAIVDQGTELGEVPAADRVSNASVDEDGALSLAG